MREGMKLKKWFHYAWKVLISMLIMEVVYYALCYAVSTFYFSSDVHREDREVLRWISSFDKLYFYGVLLSIPPFLLAVAGEHRNSHLQWWIGMVLGFLIGIILAVLLRRSISEYICEPPSSGCSLLASLLLLFQSPACLFVSSLFQPVQWIFNPLKN